jgi:hypothetical protein
MLNIGLQVGYPNICRGCLRSLPANSGNVVKNTHIPFNVIFTSLTRVALAYDTLYDIRS